MPGRKAGKTVRGLSAEIRAGAGILECFVGVYSRASHVCAPAILVLLRRTLVNPNWSPCMLMDGGKP